MQIIEGLSNVRLVVTGGRDGSDVLLAHDCLSLLDRTYRIYCVIDGKADGYDTVCYDWARENHKLSIRFPISSYEWDTYGPIAGPRRNTRMRDMSRPTLGLALPGGRGTANMCQQMRTAKIPYYQFNPKTCKLLLK